MTNSNDEHIYIQMLIRDDNIDNVRQYTTIRQTVYSQLKRREHTVYTRHKKYTFTNNSSTPTEYSYRQSLTVLVTTSPEPEAATTTNTNERLATGRSRTNPREINASTPESTERRNTRQLFTPERR